MTIFPKIVIFVLLNPEHHFFIFLCLHPILGLPCVTLIVAREILFSEPGFNPVYKCEGGAWGSWEPWSECSLTCESGHKTRTRVCSDLVNCEGPMFENVVCNTRWCPVPFELQGTCTCDPLSFSCDQSTTPNLPCEIDEKCEKFSMVSAESFRCVKKNQGNLFKSESLVKPEFMVFKIIIIF